MDKQINKHNIRIVFRPRERTMRVNGEKNEEGEGTEKDVNNQ